MGMTMGAFFFSLGSLKYPELARTAYHCTILALIFVLPTMIAGIMDWQYFYHGDWSGHIIAKFILALLLISLLVTAMKTGTREPRNPRVSILIYALCLLVAVGLGFTGGEIQYG